MTNSTDSSRKRTEVKNLKNVFVKDAHTCSTPNKVMVTAVDAAKTRTRSLMVVAVKELKRRISLKTSKSRNRKFKKPKEL